MMYSYGTCFTVFVLFFQLQPGRCQTDSGAKICGGACASLYKFSIMWQTGGLQKHKRDHGRLPSPICADWFWHAGCAVMRPVQHVWTRLLVSTCSYSKRILNIDESNIKECDVLNIFLSEC